MWFYYNGWGVCDLSELTSSRWSIMVFEDFLPTDSSFLPLSPLSTLWCLST